MRGVILGLVAVSLLVACAKPLTPTPTSTPTPSPTVADLIAINELTCVDLYPGAQPPPGSPSHTLTANGTIANRNSASITFNPLLEVLGNGGAVLGSVRGGPLVILGNRLSEPFTVTYDDPPFQQNATCRFVLLLGEETVDGRSALIDVVYAP